MAKRESNWLYQSGFVEVIKEKLVMFCEDIDVILFVHNSLSFNIFQCLQMTTHLSMIAFPYTYSYHESLNKRQDLNCQVQIQERGIP